MRFQNGWFKLHRKAAFGDLGKHLDLLGLWTMLLSMATIEETSIMWKGLQRKLPAGSILINISALADSTGVSRSLMNRRIEYLVKSERLRTETGNKGTVITIVNWHLYQAISDETGNTSETLRTFTGHSPDIHRTHIEELRTEEAKNQETEGEPSAPSIRPEDLLRIWNENRGALPEAKALSPERRRAAISRLRENPDPAFWAGIVKGLASSAFCRGDDGGWRASFDFLLRPGTHLKVSEGQYSNGSDTKKADNRYAGMTDLAKEFP